MKRDDTTLERAKALRSGMTEAERMLWRHLRAKRFGVKFTRQVPIGPYVADFAARQARLVIEVDGGQHSIETDAVRTAFLEGQGYRVIRFWNNDVLGNIDGVMERIGEVLRQAPLPHPLPKGAREPD